MESIYIYALGGFALGFLMAWVTRSFTIVRLKKQNRSLQGFLESEKLKKEILLKENAGLHVIRETAGETYETNMKELIRANKRLDEDILLLQKSNEETEALLQSGLPVVHSLKLQLIEANNTIARYKAQLDKLIVEKT